MFQRVHIKHSEYIECVCAAVKQSEISMNFVVIEKSVRIFWMNRGLLLFSFHPHLSVFVRWFACSIVFEKLMRLWIFILLLLWKILTDICQFLLLYFSFLNYGNIVLLKCTYLRMLTIISWYRWELLCLSRISFFFFLIWSNWLREIVWNIWILCCCLLANDWIANWKISTFKCYTGIFNLKLFGFGFSFTWNFIKNFTIDVQVIKVSLLFC